MADRQLMIWRGATVVALAWSLVLAMPGLAQDPVGENELDYDSFYPLHAKGFVDNVFQVNGIDDVNLFNGNLTATIPLGPALHPGADLTFQLALHYNSKVWAFEGRCPEDEHYGDDDFDPPDDFHEVPCEESGRGALVGPRYAGLGWSLELGHITRQYDPAKDQTEGFLVTPDGAQHQLFGCRLSEIGDPSTCAATMPAPDDLPPPDPGTRVIHQSWYTRDGSNIWAEFDYVAVNEGLPDPEATPDPDTNAPQINVQKRIWTVHFPDGTIAQYGFDINEDLYTNELGSWGDQALGRDHARMLDGTYCKLIRDPWGHMITIDYQEVTFSERVPFDDPYDPNDTPAPVERKQLIPHIITEYETSSASSTTWVGDDPTGRAVVITTEVPSPDMPARIASVDFRYDDVSFLKYELEYESVDRLPLVDYYGYYEPRGYGIDSRAFTDWTYILRRVSVAGMSDIAYSFRYWLWSDLLSPLTGYPGYADLGIDQSDTFVTDPAGSTPAWLIRRKIGTLRQLTPPTGASIHYDYDEYMFEYLTGAEATTGGGGACPFPGYDCSGTEAIVSLDPECGFRFHRSLGVLSREVWDGTDLLEWTEYTQGSRFEASQPVLFDLGDPGATFSGYTSSSVTRVTHHGVADESGSETDLGTQTRADMTEYRFSLGTGATDGAAFPAGECGTYDLGEAYDYPLHGSLIETRYYRRVQGDPSPEYRLQRTEMQSFTVLPGGGDLRLGGEPAARGFHDTRPRAKITYYHDLSAPTGCFLEIPNRYGCMVRELKIADASYETDLCLSSTASCPELDLDLDGTSDYGWEVAFSSNLTQSRSSDTFVPWAIVLEHSNAFAPLASIDTMVERTSVTRYLKEALLATDPLWVVALPVRSRLYEGAAAAGTPFSEQTTTYGLIDTAYRGVPTETRTHASPGTISSQDVVTTYEHYLQGSGSGSGQVRRVRTGLRGDEQAGWTEGSPTSSTFMTYDHGELAGLWSVCEPGAECPGWSADPTVGEPAELQIERTIDPAWRHATSVVDGNGDGLASITYDGIGRVVGLEPTSGHDSSSPTSPFLAATWLEYPTPNQTEVYIQDGAGDTSSADALLVARYDYDGLGRLSHVQQRLPNPASHSEVLRHKSLSYDGMGHTWREADWLASEDDGTGPATETRCFDPFGRPERVVSSDGSATRTSYDGASRTETFLTNEADSRVLQRTITELNARGSQVRVLEDRSIDCSGPFPSTCSELDETTDDFIISEHGFDLADRLTSVTVKGLDPVSGGQQAQTRTFTYDPRGFLVSETHPEHAGLATTYSSFTASGQPRRMVMPGGEVLKAELDAKRRPLRSKLSLNGGTTWWTYSESSYGTDPTKHEVGKLIESTQYNMLEPPSAWNAMPGTEQEADAVRVRHDYFYDGTAQGMLSRRQTFIDTLGSTTDQTIGFEVGYGYDMWGTIARIDYPELVLGGCLPTDPPVITYTWDPSGLVGVSQELPDGGTRSLMSDLKYDTATGMRAQWTTLAGWTGSLQSMTHRVTPDGTRARPRSIWAENGSGHEILNLGEYTYDEAGNITSLGGWVYTYDALGRLTSADSISLRFGARTYTYDDFGNLTSLGGIARSTSLATNRLSAPGYAYDANGNLTQAPLSAGGTRYARFDASNRMVAAWHSTDADEYGFVYDAAGERIARYRVVAGELQSATFSIRDEAANVLTRVEWVAQHQAGDPILGFWQPPVHHIYTGRNAFLRLEPQTTSDTSVARYVSLALDHLGSTRAEITDPASVARIDLWPYGALASAPSNLEETHLFTGHERDYLGTSVNALAGLDYMHARYYSYELGRFLSVDPVQGKVGLSQSWNRYAYVMNSPTQLVDPTGQNSEVTCDDSSNVCTVKVRSQIIRDPKSEDQVAAANDFQRSSENYWNSRTAMGPNGETIKFDVKFKQVNPGAEDKTKDALTVVEGAGRSNVIMTLNANDPAARPDRGTIYTQDSTNNPSGMEGVAPHETGHLIGLRDMYYNGEVVPYVPGANGNIMRYAQPGNSAGTAFTALKPNGNNVVVHINVTPTPPVP